MTEFAGEAMPSLADFKVPASGIVGSVKDTASFITGVSTEVRAAIGYIKICGIAILALVCLGTVGGSPNS